MRLNPMALALAFGVAKVVVSIFTILSIFARTWSMGGPMGRAPFVFMLGDREIIFQLVLGFLGGAIGGALAAVIYNKVISRSPQAAA